MSAFFTRNVTLIRDSQAREVTRDAMTPLGGLSPDLETRRQEHTSGPISLRRVCKILRDLRLIEKRRSYRPLINFE